MQKADKVVDDIRRRFGKFNHKMVTLEPGLNIVTQ